MEGYATPSPPPPPQQKRSASADPPSLSRGAAVPPKKRARNQAEPGHAETEAAGSPLDLSAPGRGRGREDPEQPQQLQAADFAHASAAGAAAAYMSRCSEALGALGLAPQSEDPADCWMAMGQWQASLHAQYLYYSSLVMSGLLPQPPPPPQSLLPHSVVGSKALQGPPHQATPMLSPSFSGLLGPHGMPPPPPPPPQPPQAMHSQLLPQQPLTVGSKLHRLMAEEQPTQHSPSPQQRRVKTTRANPVAPVSAASATVAAVAATASKSSPTSAQTATPERQTSSETDFQCSCGRAFASLITLTLHLKETGHGPGAGYNRDRDIPKLVRGQDMWINSETEQTREILRCIRCKQSFRTLPELTMHMIKTRHYTEIIYTDSGALQPAQAGAAASGSGGRLPQAGLPAKEPAAPGKEKPHQSTVGSRGGRAEVKEADSATDPQPGPSFNGGATSTLQKMQHFVEASLPRSSRRPAMFQEVLRNSVFDSDKAAVADSDNEEELPRDDDAAAGCRQKAAVSGDAVSYLSPDRPPEPKENPLSSLQKLVDTAEKTSAPASVAVTPSGAAAGASVAATSAPSPSTPAASVATATLTGVAGRLGRQDSRTPTEGPASAGAAAAGGSSRHTVIMLSPTYIYQSGLYPPFPVCHPSALLGGPGASGVPGGFGPIDLSKLPSGKQRLDEVASGHSKRSSNSGSAAAGVGESPDKTPAGVIAGASGGGGGGWPDSLMQKKAKCHYCSKPFANKGQVRLHVSKGKCPSLLARLPTAALPPFPFFPAIDYIKAAGRFHPATAPASGKELQA